MNAQAYFLKQATAAKRPVVLSSPHSGTDLTEGAREALPADLAKELPDTDWRIHELYGFAPELGMPLLHARYSRYVIDLNRHPEGVPLYDDGRQITDVIPAKSFAGDALAPNGISQEERAQRLDQIFKPYHAQLAKQLDAAQESFQHVLLFDCHSILREVPSIQQQAFPDLILGSADGEAADGELVELARQALASGPFEVVVNHPFKGGYITRHHGEPARGRHALQLEMCQDLYLTDARDQLDPEKLAVLQPLLKNCLTALASHLEGRSK